MPESPLVAATKALVVHLNAGSYGETFTAVQSYDPEILINDIDTLRCHVVPGGYITAEVGDMGGTMHYECVIDVAFRRRFVVADQESDGTIKNTEVDKIVNLVTEVYKDLIQAEGLSTYAAASIVPPRQERSDDVSQIRTTYGVVHDKKGNVPEKPSTSNGHFYRCL